MVTLATIKSQTHANAKKQSAEINVDSCADISAETNVKSSPNHESEISEQRFNEIRFKLSSNLQSTLDIKTTLHTFFDHVGHFMRCDGIKYRNDDIHINALIGTDAPHSARYNLSTKKDQLGELTFVRETRFAEAELTFLEMLVGVLFYPLRNAIAYKHAIDSSLIDALTGTKNRLALNLGINREIKLAKRHSKALSVLLIDLDYFKNINDTYGHLAGDHTLKKVAKVIENTLRETDQVFRYGGEEFIATLTETVMDNAYQIAQRIREAISKIKIPTQSGDIAITASIGISSLGVTDSFDSLFSRADKALYKAKTLGRDRAQCSDNDRYTEIAKTA